MLWLCLLLQKYQNLVYIQHLRRMWKENSGSTSSLYKNSVRTGRERENEKYTRHWPSSLGLLELTLFLLQIIYNKPILIRSSERNPPPLCPTTTVIIGFIWPSVVHISVFLVFLNRPGSWYLTPESTSLSRSLPSYKRQLLFTHGSHLSTFLKIYQ